MNSVKYVCVGNDCGCDCLYHDDGKRLFFVFTKFVNFVKKILFSIIMVRSEIIDLIDNFVSYLVLITKYETMDIIINPKP